jgi:hypothetical protein
MTALKWLRDRTTNPVTILSTELNGLANNGTVLSGVVENSATLDLYGDFALTMQFGVAPSLGFAIELYIVRSVDGVLYDDTSSGPPLNGFGDIWPCRNTTNQQTIVLATLELPPTDFKVYVRNSSGQTMAATGNLLKMNGYKRSAG